MPPPTITEDAIRRRELAELGITAEVDTDSDGMSTVRLATDQLDLICEAKHLIANDDEEHELGLHDDCISSDEMHDVERSLDEAKSSINEALDEIRAIRQSRKLTEEKAG